MKKSILYLFLLSGIIFGCKEEEKAEIINDSIEFTKDAEALLISEEGDTLQRLAIEISDDDYERETGLMYRDSMKKDQGMLFIFEDEALRGFYMKNTHFPLDIIFLDEDKRIINIARNTEPETLESINSDAPAKFVLEINGGLSDNWNLEKGDKLVVVK